MSSSSSSQPVIPPSSQPPSSTATAGGGGPLSSSPSSSLALQQQQQQQNHVIVEPSNNDATTSAAAAATAASQYDYSNSQSQQHSYGLPNEPQPVNNHHPHPHPHHNSIVVNTSNSSQQPQQVSLQQPNSPAFQQQTPPPTTTTPTTTPTTAPPNISYSAERIIGNGSFGVVFEAKVVETGDVVAIKKVLQDKRFKNRELQIMRQLVKDPHPNIVQLQHCFYSQGEKPDELYLNLVLEFVPETVYSISRRHQKHSIPLPLMYVKLYMYQLCRALAHIHNLGICHRDIKPQNLLVHPVTQQLKLCDFGSAKALIPGEPNVSYICSRYYRAPELIFGSTDYTTAIDIWSQGCVGAELLLGQPLFPGDSGVDQLVEIIKVLGTPTKEEIRSMNSNYMEFKFPQIKGCQWKKIFRNKTPDDAVAFIASNLAYTPSKRLHPLEGCAHVFFDELRHEHVSLPNNGGPLPALFNFTIHELQHTTLMTQLIPEYVMRKNNIQAGTSTTTTNQLPYSSAATSTTTSTTASPSMHSIQHPPYNTTSNNVDHNTYNDMDRNSTIQSMEGGTATSGDDQKMSAR